MKIALLTDGIQPYVTGGMQKHSYNIAKYLALNCIEVDLYHCSENPEHSINELNIFTEAEKKYISSIVISFPKEGRLPGHYIRNSYKFSERIYNELRTRLKDVDFIYAKGFTSWKLIEEKTKGIKLPPVGIKFHGYEMFQSAPNIKSRLEQWLLLRKPVRFITNNADVVFSYGGKITNIIVGLGVQPSQVITIPTGIESLAIEKEIISTNEPLKFLFVGRHERRKGINELNTVLEQLIKEHHRFTFDFIGPIPKNYQLCDSKIKYWGKVTDRIKIDEIMRSSDVLVCPSHSEGMPNVIIEAMAKGLAVIATDVGAVAEMVDNNNGLLLPECNPKLINDAILTFIKLNPQKIDEFKAESLKRVRGNFDWEHVIRSLIKSITDKYQLR